MVMKAKARTPAPAPVEDDEVDPTSVDVNTVTVEGESAGAGEGSGSDTPKRKPSLRWNAARNAALARIVREAIEAGTTPSPISITEALADDPAFAGLEEGTLLAWKVRLQINKLRKAGAAFPPLASDRRGGQAYQVDIDSLNEILGG